MIKVTIKPDYLTSLLVSYHILNAPTEMNKRFNSGVFENLQVSQEEREQYLSFLTTIGFDSKDTDEFRFSIFYPEVSTLDDFLSNIAKSTPQSVKDNLRAFDIRFRKYFNSVEEKIDPIIEQSKKEMEEAADSVYDIAESMTGIRLKRPKEIELRIVEGLSPSSFARVKSDKLCIIEQTRNFVHEGEYMRTLIHEAVGHFPQFEFKHLYNEVFGEFIYEFEEGFAKFFTAKIAERIFNRAVDSYCSKGGEKLACSIFEKNWGSLTPGNFEGWYKNCLVEIKEKNESINQS